MNLLSEAIIKFNIYSIGERILVYEEAFGLPPFIRIECGTYNRNIVSPSKEALLNEFKVPEEENFALNLNPHTLISFLPDKVKLYEEAYKKVLARNLDGSALVCIDYESENIREILDPIIYTLPE